MLELSAAGLGVLLLAVILFLGADHRAEIDARFTETITHETSLWTRSSFWKDSLAMVRYFPLFGVGLKCWPEIFPHYQRPPWTVGLFAREAHNDDSGNCWRKPGYWALRSWRGFLGDVSRDSIAGGLCRTGASFRRSRR